MDIRRIYRILATDGKQYIAVGNVSNRRRPWSKAAFEKALKNNPPTATSEFIIFDEAKYRRYRVPREWFELPIKQAIKCGKAQAFVEAS